MAQKPRAVAGGGLWEWAELDHRGLDGLKFGLYLEGTGEPWKVCKQGSSWKPEAFSGPGQGWREVEPAAGPLFFGELGLRRTYWNPSSAASQSPLLCDFGQMTYLSVLRFSNL